MKRVAMTLTVFCVAHMHADYYVKYDRFVEMAEYDKKNYWFWPLLTYTSRAQNFKEICDHKDVSLKNIPVALLVKKNPALAKQLLEEMPEELGDVNELIPSDLQEGSALFISALYYAAKHQDVSLVNLLLKHGADPNVAKIHDASKSMDKELDEQLLLDQVDPIVAAQVLVEIQKYKNINQTLYKLNRRCNAKKERLVYPNRYTPAECACVSEFDRVENGNK